MLDRLIRFEDANENFSVTAPLLLMFLQSYYYYYLLLSYSK